MQSFNFSRLGLLATCWISLSAVAEVPTFISMKEAAQLAILKSPDVQLRWHAFREAAEEVGVARGGFFPRVDLSAGAGKMNTEQRKSGLDQAYSGNETSLNLRQMVFDGFSTSNEVKKLGKAKLVRFFELLDASENVSLEAGRAYLDVVRFRYHAFLAEENYIQHQAAFEQLRKRAESGVGRRVDVEQAASRLALADVNLTTAYANLHDVSARYVRIVGAPPAKIMFAPSGLSRTLPGTVEGVLAEGLKKNPALRASIENTEASQYDLQAQRASFFPRLDIVARRDKYSNYEDNGPRDESRVQFRLQYNLFNGGSDTARNRQYRERKNMALDLREKACRDIRQTLTIAFNETLRLNDQLSFISLQVDMVERTRTAYRDQFNIGQRTLLDLLNTQNEYFDARRAQVDADIDLSVAYLRSLAGMGQLLGTLGVKRAEESSDPDQADLAKVDLSQLCPPTTPVGSLLDREALGRKAREMIENSSGSFIGGRAASAERDVRVVPSAPAGSTENAVIQTDYIGEIGGRLSEWKAAWASRDIRQYLAMYAPSFKPENGAERDTWARQREQRLARGKDIRIEIQELDVRSETPDLAITDFRQLYTSGSVTEETIKRLEWIKRDGQWLIQRELVGPKKGK